MPNMTCDPVLFKHHTFFRLQCRGDPGGEDQLRHMIDEDRNEHHAGDGGREKRRGERRADRDAFMRARKQTRKSVVWVKGGSVRVSLGGRRITNKKKKQ